ncbi:hypothetical protein P2318_07325 [Myxococcaceae bacterium GXIMD 01537]
MDYRKFLGKVESAVLPYLGGGTVDAPSRRLRVAAPVDPGWWRFDIQGRTAHARLPAEPEGLEALPLVRGHLWGQRLVRDGAVAEPLHLLPEEEAPRFSPVRARRWHDGSLLFDSLDFEGEAEGGARRALEEETTLADIKGVPASLRAAFGYTVLESVSRTLGIRFSPGEVRSRVLAVAERGRDEATPVLRHLSDERDAFARAQESRRQELESLLREEETSARMRAERARLSAQPRRAGSDGDRVERVLAQAGARVLDQRRLGHGRLEVVFRFMDERFVSVVDVNTLQVIDAGLCLAGADSEVTLESLPGVIREAIQTDRLVITRYDD